MTAGPNVPRHGACPECGKVRYRSRKDARKVAREVYPGTHLSPYRCGEFWHLGNLPRAIINGYSDRREQRPLPRQPKPEYIPKKKP